MECEEHKKSICRVCLKCDPTILQNGASIFDKIEMVFIYENLNTIADVNIKPEDGLPDAICGECLLELRNALHFKHKCESSNNVLLSAVTNSETLTKEPVVDDVNLKDEHCSDHEHYSDHENFSDHENYSDHATEYLMDRDSPSDRHIKQETKEVELQPEEEDLDTLPVTSKAINLKLECHDCGGIFRTKCKLKMHWKKEHLKEYLTCHMCKKIFSSFKAFHNHKRKNSELCRKIENIFRIEGMGKLSKFYCKHCEYSTTARRRLKEHVRRHSGEKNYQCDLCPMSFTYTGGLRSHKEYKHKIYIKEGPCNICGKYIKGLYKLHHHIRKVHLKKKNSEVTCQICHKVYKSKDILNIHMDRHTGKTYSCDVCFKEFTSASNVYSHKKNVHIKTSHKCENICPICGYSNVKSGNIKIHISKHNGINCACVVCGRFYENDFQLQLHKQRHNDRKNKCPECDKTFFRRQCLVKHLSQVHKISSLNSKK